MTPTENRPLPNASDKAQLKTIATRIIQTCPSLQDCARGVASDLLDKYAITGLDPDQVFFHRFDAAQSSSKAFSGWEHVHARPTASMTLTQLVIQRFRVGDQDNADLLDVYAGFYSVGAGAGTYNETNEVRLHGQQVLNDFWNINFSDLYTGQLKAFWQTSASDFRTLAKCNFLLSAVQARDLRQLSEDDFAFVTEAVIGPITWPVTLQQLQSEHTCSEQVHSFDIDGHTATNILRFIAPKGRQILYLPGETNAFHVLETATDLHYWVLQRMNEEDARVSFMNHFALADRQQIAENISDLMNRLVQTWGRYDHHLINSTQGTIADDAFTWLRDSTKTAMFDEAALSLTSNGDLRKKLWIGYFSAGMKILGPMAVVGWPVALPVIGASIASLGLNIDQAVNGKTSADRKAGVLGAVLAGIDLLFNLAALKGPGSLQEVGPEIDLAEAQEMAKLKGSTQSVRKPSIAVAGVQSTDASSMTSAIPASYKADLSLTEQTLIREPGRLRGTYPLQSNPSSAIKLNGNFYYVRYKSPLNGRGYWAIIDPARPDAFSGSIPVRLNASGQWEIIPQLGLKGGMWPTPIRAASAPALDQWARKPGLSVAGIEDDAMRAWALGGPDKRALFRKAWTVGSIDLSSAATSDVNAVAPMRLVPNVPDQLVELSEFDLAQEDARDELVSCAKSYYELNPPAPRLPSPTARFETTSELLDRVFAEKTGLVVGERPGTVGSKRWLIEHMPDLARRGVKTLYLQELLVNVNQMDLDAFAQSGEMPKALENYLQRLDYLTGNDPEGHFNLLGLVKAANAQRIRVQALDMSTTYNVGKDADWQPDYRMARSFFASEVIQSNEEIKGPAPWVALVDQENLASFRGYQGISEQVGATSLRIDDVAPGATASAAPSISSDPGLTVQYVDHPDSPVHDVWPEGALGEQRSLIQADWHLQTPTLWAHRDRQALEALLPEPGMFTFQRYRSSVLVIYRNSSGHITDSAIRSTPGGRLNVETPLRPAHDSLTVDSLDELKQALIDKGLKPMGWPPLTAEVDALASIASDLAPALPHIELPVIPDNWQANELLDALTPEMQPGKFRGIYRLDSNPSTAIMLDDCAYYVRYEADINGGGTWAIIDPEHPHAFSGSRPVRLNAEDEWELSPQPALKGGGNKQPGRFRVPPERVQPAVERRTTSPYDTPYNYHLRKVALGKRETHIKMVRLPNGSYGGLTAFDEYAAAHRTALSQDARLFFSSEGVTRALPPRPSLARVLTSTTAEELIQRTFETAPGLVIGESQDRIASMQFLIENMPTLAAQNVKTLYFERLLNDFNQADLNEFFKTGEMPEDLSFYLQQLQSDPSGRFTPLEVVTAAQRNGIRVQATDNLVSYRFPGSPLPNTHEQAIRTFLTHKIIEADQALYGSGKWVVLTNHENTNTFRGMPGISEMQGGVGLRIEEVLPDQPLHIETDRGFPTGRGYVSQPLSIEGDSDTVYADMSLQVPSPTFTRTPGDIARLLNRQGMFTLEQSDGTWTLIHRSREGLIVHTPVERTVDGKYLIHRPAWTEVHGVPYDSIWHLTWALNRMGMDLEGRLPL